MKKGFTLLETLVAISILLIAVVAPLSTIGGSLSSIFTARDQMIAVNFAQEGIEMVRQKRDSNMLNVWKNGVGSWGDNLSAGEYLIDATNLKGNGALLSCATSCDVGDKKSIRQDQGTGLFYQTTSASPGENTQFTRSVKIEDVSSVEKTVTSTVIWSVGGVTKKVEVKESMFGINS
ncbi:MAG: type II secretion system protein [Candidatus Yonathbacteria bacterium]|nr:type II secretion system protein [Candidatus Yonathbacteria bacterium]